MTDLFDLSSVVAITEPTKPTDKFSSLIYGRMRTGKSFLAASANEVEAMKPILWIAAEDGSASFADNHPDIDVVHPEGWADIQRTVQALVDNKTKYRTVVVDTLGEAQEIIKRDYVAKKKSMDFEGWAKIAEGVTWLVDTLHNSQYNSIFIAHTERVKDDSLGSLLHMPYLLGKKALVDVPKIIDNIFYLAKAEDEEGNMARVLQVFGTSRVDAGSRFEHKFPKSGQLVNTNFQEIYNFITA